MSSVDAVPADAMRAPSNPEPARASASSSRSTPGAFASVLTLSMRSTAWLDNLLARRAEQIPARTRVQDANRPATHAAKNASSKREWHDSAVSAPRGSAAGEPKEIETAGSRKTASPQHEMKSDAAPASAVAERQAPPARANEHKQTSPNQTSPDHDTPRTTPGASSDGSARTAGDASNQLSSPRESATRPATTTQGTRPTGRQAVNPTPVTGSQAGAGRGAMAMVTSSAVQPTQTAIVETGGGTSATTAAKPMSTSSSQGADFLNTLQQAGRSRAAGGKSAPARASAPTRFTQADTSVNVQRAESMQKLARVLRSTIKGQNASMSLRLDPPEMGRIRIDVRMQGQVLTVRIETDAQAGHDLLRGRLADLQQALETQGVHVDRLDVQMRPAASASGTSSRDASDQMAQHGQDTGREAPGYSSGDWSAESGGQGSNPPLNRSAWNEREPGEQGSSEPADPVKTDEPTASETLVDVRV